VCLLNAKQLAQMHHDDQIEEIFAVRVRAADDGSTVAERLAAADVAASGDKALDDLLHEFRDVLAAELPAGLPPERGIEHHIDIVTGSRPPALPLRRYSPKEDEEMERQVKAGIEKGHIRPSTSPFGAMVLFVKKKDGTLRMCVDYRALNNQTVKNRYALPLADDLFDRVLGAKFFSKLDLNAGFNQIRVAPDSVAKTAFRTRFGHFEYTVLPMGLCNAPATFMNLMNTVFRDELGRCVLVFLDDILVFSRTREQHLADLRGVLARLRQQRLYAKPSKCEWLKGEVEFLGHRIGRDGLSVMQEKVEAIRSWPTPSNVSDVRSFLGLAGFYRRFVKGFSEIALPLTELTKETQEWVWGSAQGGAFKKLQAAISAAPVLAIADPDRPYTLHIDASGYAVGAALQQDQGEGLQPIAFMSQKMKPAETRYAVHEQELLALVTACRHWRHYLHNGHPFTILSDHNSLKYFTTQPILSNRQARWKDQLAEFDFKIQYIEGPKNVVADALSRRSDHKAAEPTGQPEAPRQDRTPPRAGEIVSKEQFLATLRFRDGPPEEEPARDDPPPAGLAAARAAPLATDPATVARQRAEAIKAATTNTPAAEAGDLPPANKKGVIVMPTQRSACTADTKTGGQCRARTAKGQYCFAHRKAVAGLRIKKSERPGLGNALWAERDFRKDEFLADYSCKRVELYGDRDEWEMSVGSCVGNETRGGGVTKQRAGRAAAAATKRTTLGRRRHRRAP